MKEGSYACIWGEPGLWMEGRLLGNIGGEKRICCYVECQITEITMDMKILSKSTHGN